MVFYYILAVAAACKKYVNFSKRLRIDIRVTSEMILIPSALHGAIAFPSLIKLPG